MSLTTGPARPAPPARRPTHPALAAQAALGRAVLRWQTPALVRSAVAAALLVAAVAAATVVLAPSHGPLLGIAVLLGGIPVALGAVALARAPWLTPWVAVALFSTTAELRLRVDPAVGVLKDAYVLLLLGLLVVHLWQHPTSLRRLRPLALPLAALGVLVALYVADPAGGHSTSWIYGTRLLVEVLALLVVGLALDPARALPHLVGAFTLVLPAEAVLAWVQQSVGMQQLVYGWGYEFGSQVRLTSTGGLRVSGSFEDPFQLAALAVLGTCLAVTVASRRQAVVLVVSALAVLGATSVRTAFLQVVVVVVVVAVRRGYGRHAVALGAVGAVGLVFVLATTTSAISPGAPEEPLLFSLNGRSTSWALAVDGVESMVVGNGVGARGIGSGRTTTDISAAPAYDPDSAPTAYYAGNTAFLDSSYAQVQSDTGIVGTVALVTGFGGLAWVAVRRGRRDLTDGPAWAATAVLAVTLLDWVGRSSLASYTTGFLTLYVLGVVLGAGLHRSEPR